MTDEQEWWEDLAPTAGLKQAWKASVGQPQEHLCDQVLRCQPLDGGVWPWRGPPASWQLGRSLLGPLLVSAGLFLLAFLGAALAVFARIWGKVGDLLQEQAFRDGHDENATEVGSLDAKARTGANEPQVLATDDQQSDGIGMVVRHGRQVLEQERQRNVERVFMSLHGDLQTQGLQQLGDDERAPDLLQQDMRLGTPKQRQSQMRLERQKGTFDVPSPGVELDHVV